VIIDRNTAKDVLGGYTDSGGNVSNEFQREPHPRHGDAGCRDQ
jgi:hypothetical protein